VVAGADVAKAADVPGGTGGLAAPAIPAVEGEPATICANDRRCSEHAGDEVQAAAAELGDEVDDDEVHEDDADETATARHGEVQGNGGEDGTGAAEDEGEEASDDDGDVVVATCVWRRQTAARSEYREEPITVRERM
jgi:hypothetical protein